MSVRRLIYAFTAFVAFASLAAAAPPADPQLLPQVSNWRLIDQHDRSHELYRQGDRRAVVVFSLAIDSGYAHDDLVAAARLRRRYNEDTLSIFAIAPKHEDNRSRLAKRYAALDTVPILWDGAQFASESLGLSHEAECVVLDPSDWSMRYRGPVRDEEGDVHPELMRTLFGLVSGVGGAPIVLEPRGDALTFDTFSEVPTYVDDVAPLLAKHCVKCHSEGNIGPFVMDSYRRMRGWAPMIREVVMTKRMPPWHADPHYNEFANGSALTPAEARTIVEWVEGGTPRGEGDDILRAASAAAESDGWFLGEPDHVVSLEAVEEIPPQGVLDYRYRYVPVNIDEDKWVSAVEVRPGNLEATHHTVVTVTYPEEYKDREPGWWDEGGGYFGLYVPGILPEAYPEGTARFLPKGSVVEFQLHYTTTGKEETDIHRLGLHFCDEPDPVEFRTVAMRNWEIEIPAGARDHGEVAEYVFSNDALLWGLNPHMHLRGSRFSYTAVYPDGRRELLLNVPFYDFNWQTEYRLAEPKRIPAGTRLVGVAGYDNSPMNPHNPRPDKVIRWGSQSWDEMLVAYISFTEVDNTSD